MTTLPQPTEERPWDGIDFALMLTTAIVPPHWPWACLLAVEWIARRNPAAAQWLREGLGWNAADPTVQWVLPGLAALPALPVPVPVPVPAESPAQAETDADADALALPVREWAALVNDRLDEAPHTLIIGDTGSGKTTLAQALLVARRGQFVIADPKPKPGRWGGLPFITIDDDAELRPIEALMQDVLTEIKRRLFAMREGVEVFEPLTVVVDEVPLVKSECPTFSTMLKRVGSVGRELGIRAMLITQSDRVKTLGIEGEGDARGNYTIIRLGKPACQVQPACKDQPRPAALEWRGEHLPIETAGLPLLAARSIRPSRCWHPADDLLSSLLAGHGQSGPSETGFHGKAPSETGFRQNTERHETSSGRQSSDQGSGPDETNETSSGRQETGLGQKTTRPPYTARILELFGQNQSIGDIVKAIWGNVSGPRYNKLRDEVESVIRLHWRGGNDG